MAVRIHTLMTVAVTAGLAAGCSLMSFGRDEPQNRQPEPLAAAPAGTVTGEALPPPGAVAPDQPPPLGCGDPAAGCAQLDRGEQQVACADAARPGHVERLRRPGGFGGRPDISGRLRLRRRRCEGCRKGDGRQREHGHTPARDPRETERAHVPTSAPQQVVHMRRESKPSATGRGEHRCPATASSALACTNTEDRVEIRTYLEDRPVFGGPLYRPLAGGVHCPIG